MKDIDKKLLEDMIRKVISEKFDENSIKENPPKFEKRVDPSGVLSIKTSTVIPEKFDTGADGDKVYLKDVITIEESPRLGCGIMEMEESTFEWTLRYDEIDYIIEGTLEILIDGRKVVGNKGDIIFIPKNSSIQFSVPKSAKFMYVTYPADWADQV